MIPRAQSPESVGVNSREVLAFLEDAKQNNLEFHSCMVIRHDQVAVEWYNEPYNKDTPHMMYSFSKAVTATAIGFAADEGLLSLEDKVLDFFPDYVPKKDSPNFDKLTVRNLITMTSGLNPNFLADKGKIDWIKDYLNSPWLFTPGDDMLYISENIFMCCAILHRATGMSVVDFLMPRLFEPLGIDRPFWETDHQGVEAGGWGLYLKTEDMAKFMLCYLHEGMYGGKQVIPADFAREAVKRQLLPNQRSAFRDNRIGYGYCFWQTATSPMNYRADGLFAQYGVNFPELDAIFICTGGIAEEQVARDCVWRHFPKAFLEECTAPVTITNWQCDEPVKSMRPSLESKLNGKLIQIMPHPELQLTGFEPSMLPVAVTYMMTEKGKTPSDVILNFYPDEMTLTWNEGYYKNTIKLGMDGTARYDTMHVAGMDFKVASYAKWLSPKTLELHVRPYETVGKRIFRLTFEAGGIVKIQPDGVPTMKEVCGYLGHAAAEVIPFPALIKAAGYLSYILPPLAEPPHFGKVK